METEGEKLGKIIKGLGGGLTETQKENIKKKLRRPPTSEEEQQMKRAREICEEEGCTDMKQKYANTEEFKACFEMLSQFRAGVYCAIIGSNASEYASVDSSGSITNVKVSASDAQQIFSVCSGYFNTLCVMTNVYAYAEQSGQNAQSPSSRNAKGNRVYQICQRIPELDTCKDDLSKCDEAIKVQFLEAFVSVGKDCGSSGEDGEFEQGSANLEYLANEIEANKGDSGRLLEGFGSVGRRLESEVKSSCSVEVGGSGFLAVATGKTSGIDFSEYVIGVNAYGVMMVLAVFGLFW